MVKGFKVDYYYKYIGNKDKYFYWNDMSLVLDGRWHKCIKTDIIYNTSAKFKGMKYGHYWFKEDFIESKYPPRYKIKKLLEEI